MLLPSCLAEQRAVLGRTNRNSCRTCQVLRSSVHNFVIAVNSREFRGRGNKGFSRTNCLRQPCAVALRRGYLGRRTFDPRDRQEPRDERDGGACRTSSWHKVAPESVCAELRWIPEMGTHELIETLV